MRAPELDLDLDTFEGPFDLLLTLVLREELALGEVDVAEIVLAYVERLAERGHVSGTRAAADGAGPAGTGRASAGLESTVPPAAAGDRGAGLRAAGAIAGPGSERLDLEGCGEFLVLVASLLELKARDLFPDEDVDLSELDPEEAAEELARRLEEYRRIKAAATWLAERLEHESDRYFRVGPPPLQELPERRLAPGRPEQLAAAMRLIAQEPPQVSLAHMGLRFPPIERFLERFRAVLRRRRAFVLDAELEGLSRLEQAAAFLAVLELRKANEVRLEQAAPFAPIRVLRLDVERSTAWKIARSA